MIPLQTILNEQEDINDFEATYENKPVEEKDNLTKVVDSDTSKLKK